MLFYFLLGFLFGIVGVDIILSLGEMIKGKINLRIVQYNAQMLKINQTATEKEDSSQSTRVIGFSIPSEEEEEEYYE